MSSTFSAMPKTVSSIAAKASATARAKPQGGILQGSNPSQYDPTNPIIMFIIQAGIIIVFCRLLHFPLSKLRQPRVIAEVIGGILLGPSVMGRIPGFTNAIFPAASMPVLTMAANLGLILFLFLVGLEVDLRMFISNWRVAFAVSAAGMILPFGLGCGIAWGLYKQFHDEPGTVPIRFGVYMLFVGVAMAITAFPVLCRILTELKLLQTQVGVIVLSAGVGNDVTGWILLALCVALVNAGSGLTALYVFLTCIAYVLFLVFAIRPGFMCILRRTGSLQNGPTQSVVAMTVLMALTSAFFTGIIGIHPIFGAFLVGLICPHDGGFAIKLTEKIEDLVGVLLLPLYFALSGLSTNIGLLDNGITWAYVVGVVAIAFFGKIAGGTIAARLSGTVWRESFTIGVLMSCKGLVELIVLNIGLQARILSTRTFTIFVVMALITTFATTPVTLALYPPWYQRKLEAWKRGEIDWDGNRLLPGDGASDKDTTAAGKARDFQVGKLLVYLRLDSLPALFTFISLLGQDSAVTPAPKVHRFKQGDQASGTAVAGENTTTTEDSAVARKRPLEVHGLRMLELTERTSSVMKGSEVGEFSDQDPIVNVLYTFGSLNNVAVSGGVAVVPEGSYAETLNSRASELSSDLTLIPWSETGSMSEGVHSVMHDGIENRFASGPHNEFILSAMNNATANTAVFINRGFGGKGREQPRVLKRAMSGLSLRSMRDVATAPVADRSHHIFFPFFGDVDDRVALRFVLQLAQNINITATITYVHDLNPVESETLIPSSSRKMELPSPSSPSHGTSTRDPNFPSGPSAEEAAERDRAFYASLRDSLSASMEKRVAFETVNSSQPLKDTVTRARAEVGQSPKNAGDLVVIGRNKRSKWGMRKELMAILSSLGRPSGAGTETRESLGDMAEAMIVEELQASILVLQAGGKGLEM